MPGKNHSACGGLQNFCYDRVDLLAEIRTAVFDHDHCTIFHISYTLIDLFAFLNDIDDQFFTGQQDRLYGICQIIYIQDADPLKLCDFVQIIIICENRTVQFFGNMHQFGICFPDILYIKFND